jgi:hypothetical protein
VTERLPTTGGARAVVWLGALAYFAAALAWLGSASRAGDTVFPPGSAFDTSPTGLSLAHRYLTGRVGRPGGPARVDLLTREVGPHLEARAVVLRVRPRAASSPLLLSGPERAFVSGGGRLVLGLRETYGPLRLAGTPGRPLKVFPAWPGVGTLRPPVPRRLSAGLPAEAHSVFAIGGAPAVARAPIGGGELVLLALPETIENGGLDQADHLRLLEALAGGGRPVYFDEHAHGLEGRPGVISLLAGWGFGPLLVLLAVTGLALLWRERARLGPALDDHRERRSDAVDLLDSLALLYGRSLGRTEVQAALKAGGTRPARSNPHRRT